MEYIWDPYFDNLFDILKELYQYLGGKHMAFKAKVPRKSGEILKKY